jgi:hypothetical protein
VQNADNSGRGFCFLTFDFRFCPISRRRAKQKAKSKEQRQKYERRHETGLQLGELLKGRGTDAN